MEIYTEWSEYEVGTGDCQMPEVRCSGGAGLLSFVLEDEESCYALRDNCCSSVITKIDLVSQPAA